MLGGDHVTTTLIIAAAAGLTLLVALAAMAILRRRRRSPRYPVVLVHGVLGFDAIEVQGARAEYFRGIRAALEQDNITVHTVRVSPLAAIDERAAQLAEQVRALGARRVNLIAHSMGGLDARYAITHLGLAKQVAALITIGTPHRGTPLADLGTGLLGVGRAVRLVLKAAGLDLPAFYDLTVEHMTRFNNLVADSARVRYGCVVAAVSPNQQCTHPFLVPAGLYLQHAAGPNDGLVPTSSQRWGEVVAEIQADHWAQIGWSTWFAAPPIYRTIATTLGRWGC